jgi:hypothetical protein
VAKQEAGGMVVASSEVGARIAWIGNIPISMHAGLGLHRSTSRLRA